MRWRQVLLLWAVCLALAAEWTLVERRRPPADAAPVARPLFLDVDPAAMREVRITRDGRTVVVARRGEGWAVTEPGSAAVPSGLLAAYATALGSAEEIAHVAGPGDDARAFGLDERAVRVEVRGQGPPVVVAMGGTNPQGTAVYARRAGSLEVILIGRQVRYYEDLIFQALSAAHAPAADQDAPVG
jgi:hypothetical protein